MLCFFEENEIQYINTYIISFLDLENSFFLSKTPPQRSRYIGGKFQVFQKVKKDLDLRKKINNSGNCRIIVVPVFKRAKKQKYIALRF